MATSSSKHLHYHHLVAENHRGLGQAWGECFGEVLHQEIAEQARDFGAKQIRQCRAALRSARTFCPELVEEIEGIAEACGHTPEATYRALVADGQASPYESCTTLVGTDGLTIAHNEDWAPEAAQWLIVLRRSLPHRDWLELHYLPSLGGNAFSVHSFGHCQAINSLPHGPARTEEGALAADLVARRLSESPDPEADLRELRARPRAGGYAHTILGPSGLLLVEQSSQRLEVARCPLPYVHTNHRILSPNRGDLAEASVSDSSHRRFARAQVLLATSEAHSASALEAILDDQIDGPEHGLCNRSTIARCIAKLDPDGCSVRIQTLREAQRGFVEYRVERR